MITPQPKPQSLPYSLHDQRVTGMALHENTLTFRFAGGFWKVDPPCGRVNGSIEFSDVDPEFCTAYVLDFCGNEGRFTGEKFYLTDYIARYGEIPLEIVDETYQYNHAKFSGYLCKGESMIECLVEVYFAGEMRYITTE